MPQSLVPLIGCYCGNSISKRFGPTLVLDDANIFLRRGEVHGIVGHNGAGKSTLIKILAGALQPDSGQLKLDGKDLVFATPADAARSGIACVFQELSLLDNLTVAQNLFLGDEMARMGVLDRKAMSAAAKESLEAYGLGLTGRERISSLPVSKRQMIEIVRALRRNAGVILLDEPTTSLDAAQIEHLISTLRRIARDNNIALAIVDHKLEEIFAVCDRITALVNGRVVLSSPIADVSRTDVVECIVGVGDARVLTPRTLDRSSRWGTDATPPILSVSGIGSDRGLKDVSLIAVSGEVLGIYGLVGSGRSRLLRTLYGVEPILRGEMNLAGRPYRPRAPRDALRNGLAFVSEERKVNGFIPQFDAIRNSTLPILGRYVKFGMLRQSEASIEAKRVLQRLRIHGDIHAPLVHLSGGNQQKVLIARAILQKPRLLLLDEPTKGIDVGTKAQIHEIIRGLAIDTGLAIVVVSTEEEEILSVADNVVVLRDGHCDGRRYHCAELSVVDLRRLALDDTPVARNVVALGRRPAR